MTKLLKIKILNLSYIYIQIYQLMRGHKLLKLSQINHMKSISNPYYYCYHLLAERQRIKDLQKVLCIKWGVALNSPDECNATILVLEVNIKKNYNKSQTKTFNVCEFKWMFYLIASLSQLPSKTAIILSTLFFFTVYTWPLRTQVTGLLH